MAAVFQSERFFREAWPQISQAFESPTDAASDVEWIVGVAALEAGARILDAPCGFGRHSIELARRGFQVTGVDFSETELDRARKAATEAGVPLRLVCQDIRDMEFPGEFDLAVNLFSSIGYFSDDEDRLVIDRFWRALKPGGVFVLDTRNRDQLVRSLPPAWSSSPGNSARVREGKETAPMATESRPLVVLAGPINPDGKALLEREARVVVCDDETEAGLARIAAEAAGILFRLRPSCTESLMAACTKLRVVGRHGVGLDTVDIPAATRLGVAVVHAPGSNSQAVAEHALMLMLACVKRTRLIDTLTRTGDWGATRVVGNTELAGKTLGIVGVGNIGRRVAKFASALGMRVLG